jgi:hypothetical protein
LKAGTFARQGVFALLGAPAVAAIGVEALSLMPAAWVLTTMRSSTEDVRLVAFLSSVIRNLTEMSLYSLPLL